MTKKINNTISINNYKSKLSEIDRFHSNLFEALGDSLFHIDSLDKIIYNSLRIISPINKYLRNSNSSIDKKCGEVLEYFGIEKVPRTSIKNLKTGKVTNNDNELRKSYTQRYLEWILRLKQPPKYEYDSLSIQAERHLVKITDRLKHYSQERAVLKFKDNAQRPTSHEERTILDFYQRCIKEQSKIIEFIYYGGLKERAILKSTYFIVDIPLSFIYGFSDFPYITPERYSSALFDHTRISKSAHRIGDLQIKEGLIMERLYEINKPKFYEKYFRRNPKNAIIQEIEFNLNKIPLTPDRVEFIKEIIYLFRKKRWVSFYGLALSQIEGLFSEMLEFLPKNINERSLPNKVNSLRAFYSLSGSYFDYFQYHIPNLRNRFMHGALDGSEKDRLNSYDFLLDIQFLLNTAKQLDSPYISLNNTLNNQNIQVSTLEDISIMFDLTNKLKPEQKKELDIPLKDFYEARFIETSNIDYFLHGIDVHIDREIERLDNIFYRSTNLSLKVLKYNQMVESISDKEVLEELIDELMIEQTMLQKFNTYQVFYKNYKKKFPTLNSQTEKLIQKTFEPRKSEIIKLSYLAGKVLDN